MTTPARILLYTAFALPVISAGPFAAAAEAVPDSFRQCAGISDPAHRLACFDDAMKKLGVPVAATPATVASPAVPATAAAAGATAAVTAAPAPAPAPVLTPEEKFGATGELKKKQEPKPAEPELDELTANIREVRQTASGNYVVTLDNGQVWRQVTPAPMMMKTGEPVTIKPRALGSFWMIDASGRGSRVKRIQ